ncbi:MAG TPA: hypothetical protein VFM36_14030, partial [Thermoanaerobaculia bacterium]|nr:hypothetical protein [Thermoanaerobaculia bacterium]
MNRYWRSVEERDRGLEQHEIDDGRNEPNRRDFLKAAGFTLAGLSAACQRPPVGRAIPYLTAPEEIVPGRAYWMASTCHGCAARCGVLVKCRDGRPIKIEGNPEHPLSRGGLCATGQASVLELYDSHRLNGPMISGAAGDPARETYEDPRAGLPAAPSPSWAEVDALVAQKLASSKKVRVVSSTLGSPAASRVIERFLSRFEDGRHVIYDVPSSSAIADAHAATHGMRVIPRHRFDRADVTVSLDADFLGTWISPVQFTKEWAARKPGSWHVQLESRMSLTGSKADQRVRIHPDEFGDVLSQLGGEPKGAVYTRIYQRLAAAKGRSLVVSGSPRVADQILVNRLNEALGNYGQTVFLDEPSYQREGNDAALAQLIEELPDVDALFVVDCNPVYDLTEGHPIAEKLGAVPLVVTFA